MKKQITLLVIAALILGGLTACSDRAAEGDSASFGDSSLPESSSSESLSVDSSVFSDSSSSAESSESRELMLYPVEEVIQMFKPMREYFIWDYKMFPFDGNKEIVDMEQVITAERLFSHNTLHSIPFFKVVEGDVRTEEQFMAKLDSLLSEKAKKAVLEAPTRYFEFFEGDLYIAMPGPGGYGGPGYDYFSLDSAEYIDENTVFIKVTGYFNGIDGVYEPYSHIGTATLVKTEDGFVIDEYDYSIETILLHCDKLVYNGETIEL